MPTATASVSVEDAVNRRRGDLVELSHSIHAEPELAFAEFKSCAKTQALVAEYGFEITAAPGGLDTAFRADFGSGPLVIGICAEYDALPGIGHACGHNIIAASAVGTALALAEVADDLGLTVVLLGTPAEEAGGGKVLLLKAGTFDDIAATVMLHPGPIDIARARSLAASQVEVSYLGREAHAAVAPYLGVNAADAVTVAQVAIGLLRQQFVPGQMAHGIVTDGGQATNVIPAHSALRYTMRANDAASLRHLEDRMADCFLAGAVATGCDYEVEETEPPYHELTPDKWLADTFRGGDDPAGPDPGGRGCRGGGPTGQHRHGQRHAGDAGHPPDRRHRCRGRFGAPAGLRRGRRGAECRQSRRRRRDHAGAHGGQPGRDTHRAGSGARAPGGADGVMKLADAAEGWLADHYDDVVTWRRHIHAHPELGRQEFATTEFVAAHLADAGLNPKVLPGGTGLICDFGPDDGPRIALRADMDALPMTDRTGMPYASVVPNVAHACGHDAHTAVLLGAALALAAVPELPVGVRLIFQAAEELMPGGAVDAIAAGALAGVSRIFALHCDPRLAVGRVAVRAGPITSAADHIEVTLHSQGGHTSRPHLTGDLVYGLGTLITGVPGVLSRRIDPRNSTVMVWGAVNAGVAANAIPQTGTLAGTVRTANRDTWLTLESIVRETVTSLLAPLGIEHTLQYKRGVPPVVNEEISTRILTHAIEAIGPDVLCRHPSVRRWRGLLLVSRGGAGCHGEAGRLVWPRAAAGSAPADIRHRRASTGGGCSHAGEHRRTGRRLLAF